MGTILGRNAGLWTGAIAAVLNALVLLGIWTLTSEQLAGVDVAAFALVALIANASDPTTAPTFALTTKAPSSGSGTTTGS